MMKKEETTNKLERKTIERNRRIQMKSLYLQLRSLIPEHFNPSKEYLSRQDQLEQVAEYIKQLRARIEELKKRKNSTSAQASSTSEQATNYMYNNDNSIKSDNPMCETKLAILQIREMGSNLEVVLISGINKNFRMHQIISIVEEEGAQVVNVTISNTGDKIFHTLHAQVKVSRVGVDIARISERLHELIS